MSILGKKEFHDEVWSGREVEINTLWQRSIMLGAFLIGIFTAYFTFLDSFFEAKPDNTDFWKWYLGSSLLALLGYVVSLLWICMGKGSKYWYESYEQALSAMYDDRYNNGLINKSLIQEDRLSYFRNLYENNVQEFFPRHGSIPEPGSMDSSLLSNKAAQYSVSKVNIVLGRVMAIVWVGVFIVSGIKFGIDKIGLHSCCRIVAYVVTWIHPSLFLGFVYGVAINWIILIAFMVFLIYGLFAFIVRSTGEHDGKSITTRTERIITEGEKQSHEKWMDNVTSLLISKIQNLDDIWQNPDRDMSWNKLCALFHDSYPDGKRDIIKDLLTSKYKDHVMNYVQRECFVLDEQLNETWHQVSNVNNSFEINSGKIGKLNITYGNQSKLSIPQKYKSDFGEPDNIHSEVYRRPKNAHHSKMVDVIWRLPEQDGFHYCTIRLSDFYRDIKAGNKLFLTLSYFYDGQEQYRGMYEKEKPNSSIKNEKPLVRGRNNG